MVHQQLDWELLLQQTAVGRQKITGVGVGTSVLDGYIKGIVAASTVNNYRS